jgi:hypothetical protein
MINNTFIIAAVAAVFCVGCSEEYSHRPLGADSPEARMVMEMTAALRQAGPGELDETIARQANVKLTKDELNALRFGLDRIVTADSVELQKIEKFGAEIYRVVFTLNTGQEATSQAMLLAFDDDGSLKWIGKN